MSGRFAIIVVLLAAGSSAAHDYWLIPATFRPTADKPTAIRLYVGDEFLPEAEKPWEPARSPKVELVTIRGTANLFAKTRDGERPAIVLPGQTSGTSVLRFDRDWTAITLPAEKFNAYLTDEGLTAALAARKLAGEESKEGRERYRRCLKTFLQIGPTTDDIPTKPLGQALELLPTTNPYRLRVGEELTVQVRYDGKPQPGIKVEALRRTGDKLVTVTSISTMTGMVTLKLPTSGVWLIRTVHMTRSTDPSADWESTWASFTFQLDD